VPACHSAQYISQFLFTNLPSPAFDQYFFSVFLQNLSGLNSHYFIHCVLNFGVQQLAVRSLLSPVNETYVQVGCFHFSDFTAAILECMPHTKAYFLPGQNCKRKEETILPLQGLLNRYPKDNLADFSVIQGDYKDIVGTEIKKVGFLVVLNQNSPSCCVDIICSLPDTLTKFGCCLIVDTVKNIKEVEQTIIKSDLKVNCETFFQPTVCKEPELSLLTIVLLEEQPS